MENLSEAEKDLLLACPHVEKVTRTHIVFTADFKARAVEANLEGVSPKVFFSDSGIDVSLLSENLPKKCVSRWKKIYLEGGPEAFTQETRGKGATGRPKKKFASPEAELAYLRLENDFLKKLHALAASKEKKGSR